jgi:hypothetical protein
MAKGLGDHPALFSDPRPPRATLDDQIAATEQAQVVADKGGKGAAAARDVQLGILVGMMESELVYIQSVADTGTPDEAISTLLAGGVEIARSRAHGKAVLGVRQEPAPGSVILDANARELLGRDIRRKHFFHWAYTTDGKTFVDMPSTPEARTTLSGLTPLTTVGFRVAVAKTQGVVGPWSHVVSFLVQ